MENGDDHDDGGDESGERESYEGKEVFKEQVGIWDEMNGGGHDGISVEGTFGYQEPSEGEGGGWSGEGGRWRDIRRSPFLAHEYVSGPACVPATLQLSDAPAPPAPPSEAGIDHLACSCIPCNKAGCDTGDDRSKSSGLLLKLHNSIREQIDMLNY